MYTAPIVIKRHVIGFHYYADDAQIYMSFNSADALQPSGKGLSPAVNCKSVQAGGAGDAAVPSAQHLGDSV